MKHKNQPEQPVQPGPPKRKLSEMISEFAGDFIRLGETPEAKQNYLTGACTAWNIASALPGRRKKLVDDFVAEYKRHNPNIDEAALLAIRKDMEHLIDVKLKMFPHDIRQIVNAQYICTKAEPGNLLEFLVISAGNVVAGDHKRSCQAVWRPLQTAKNASSLRAPIGSRIENHGAVGEKLLRLRVPVAHHGGWANDQRWRFPFALLLGSLEDGEGLEGLAQAHVIGQDAVQAVSV